MLRFKAGDAAAFDWLLAKYERPVYALARRFLGNPQDAEDIAQEAFLRLYRAAPAYEPTARFSTFLFTIVKNLCLNLVRGRKGTIVLSLDDDKVPKPAGVGLTAEDAMEKREVQDLVIAAIDSLPEQTRLAVLLTKYHGFSYEEVGEVLGCGVEAVKSRIHRAKIYLRKILAAGSGAKPDGGSGV